MQPRAHRFVHLLRHLQGYAALGRRLHDGGSEHVVRSLFEGSAEHQHLIGVLAGRDLDGEQPRTTDG